VCTRLSLPPHESLGTRLTAKLLVTKVIPLWVGARGVEFRWINQQSALDANINLVSCAATLLFDVWMPVSSLFSCS